ncbi:MAG: hypothetical protein IPN89_08950 [Saprospiraceae bacterium]|nr:hypothetical protein [Saprospiraceae bacterium]
MSFFSEKTNILLEVSDAILDLPKVSIMCASDELCVFSLTYKKKEKIQISFYVTRKYNYMTDELEKKEEMFIGVTKNFGVNKKRF